MTEDMTIETTRQTCEDCGFVAITRDRNGIQLLQRYDGDMLCASCRVTQRLADDDYS